MASIPLPPYFGSTMIPKKPRSPIFLTNSFGNSCLLSLSITPGNNSVCAKSLAAS